MIEKIKLALVNESGDVVPVESISDLKLGVKIEITIADYFAEIRNRTNAIADEEIKTAEKFNFALNLKKYLEEMEKDLEIKN